MSLSVAYSPRPRFVEISFTSLSTTRLQPTSLHCKPSSQFHYASYLAESSRFLTMTQYNNSNAIIQTLVDIVQSTVNTMNLLLFNKMHMILRDWGNVIRSRTIDPRTVTTRADMREDWLPPVISQWKLILAAAQIHVNRIQLRSVHLLTMHFQYQSRGNDSLILVMHIAMTSNRYSINSWTLLPYLHVSRIIIESIWIIV